MPDAAGGLKSPQEPVRRLRRALRRAQADLAQIDDARRATDRYGTYRLAPGEPLDDSDLLAYLHRARREHPHQELVIAVTAKAATDPPSPKQGPSERSSTHV